MGKFLLNFFAALSLLATAIGLYLAADVVQLNWLFWVVLGLSVVFALARLAWPPLLRVLRQWRKYPALEVRVAALEIRIVKLKSSRDAAREEARTAREEGIGEGIARAVGAVLAAAVDAPVVTSIADYQGQVTLVGESTKTIPLRARFRVVVSQTGAERGVVQVIGWDATRKLAFLACVEPTTPAFWSALRDRVEIDTSPPHGVSLERFALPAPPQNEAHLGPVESSRPEVQE